MSWTVVPVSKPLFVVPAAVSRPDKHSTQDELIDILDSLESVNFDPREVYGVVVGTDYPSPDPIGYLCGHRSYMAPEWAPFFTASTSTEASIKAQAWVNEHIGWIRAQIAKLDN